MKVFKKEKSVVSRKIAGELFLVPVSGKLADMQNFYALTPVAEFIWERLDGKTGLDEIREAVLARFDVTREQAEADISEFAEELATVGLVLEDEDAMP